MPRRTWPGHVLHKRGKSQKQRLEGKKMKRRERGGMVVLMYHGPAIWRGREKGWCKVERERERSRAHTHACMPYMVWPAYFCKSGASDQVGLTRGSVGGDVIQK
jgi:hypothetical protein